MTSPIIAPATCSPAFPAPGSHPSALAERLLESGAEVMKATIGGLTDYWMGAVERRATPFDVASDVMRWWSVATRRPHPTWSLPHEVVFETPVARLRDFSDGSTDAVVPTLVFPPQAGHDSCIVDYSREQSQMKVIRAAGLTRAYSLDWVGATPQTKDAGIDDYLAVVDRAVEHLGGGPVNLVGDCQGGWLATIYAALHPELVNTLTIAGAPIDFHAGEAAIHDYVSELDRRGDLAFYRWLVGLGGGVLKGELMLNGFIAIKPENEVEKQLQLLAHLDDAKHVERFEAFETWFKHTQDIPGAFYLWIVEHLFRDNELIRGELEVVGQRVDLARLDCPLFLLAGQTDHITPPAQVFAAAGAVSTHASQVVERTTSGGHLGLFMGREALRDHWPPILAAVFDRSKRETVKKGPVERRARATTPKDGGRGAIPAP